MLGLLKPIHIGWYQYSTGGIHILDPISEETETGSVRRARLLSRCLFAIIIANYIAQIPYNLSLYGTAYNPRGVVLLGLTLVWFVVATVLWRRRSALGFWLLVGFLATDFGFYLLNLVGGLAAGYGPFFELGMARNALLWAVFFIGYINFLAAGILLVMLLARRED